MICRFLFLGLKARRRDKSIPRLKTQMILQAGITLEILERTSSVLTALRRREKFRRPA
jgi:hypothetical protein